MPGALLDLDLAYEEWFREHGVDAVLVRPDFHIFASARRVEEAGEPIDALASAPLLSGSNAQIGESSAWFSAGDDRCFGVEGPAQTGLL